MYILLNTRKSLFIMNKVYKFKIFKKTTKFKKYNKGLTKFIINRKKYILRKKKTSYAFLYNLSFWWTKSYMILRQSLRFFQMYNIFDFSLTLSNKNFLEKMYFKNPFGMNNLMIDSYVNYSTITKSIYFNKSLFYFTPNLSYKNIFKNSHIGLIFYNSQPQSVENTLNSGIIYSGNTQYTSLVKKNQNPSLIFWKQLNNQLFLYSINLIKNFRKIITLLTLFYCFN